MWQSRGIRAAVGLVVALVPLAACGGPGTGSEGPDAAPADVVDQGYQSGDGTVTTWAGADRIGPIELVGTDFAGKAHDVAEWRGDVVVLNTWYAACPPCRAEAPDLTAFANDYAPLQVHTLGINGVDDAGAAQAFERTFDTPYPSIQDTDGSAVAALQTVVPVQAVPTTVVIDRRGRVAARIIGRLEAGTLRSLVDDALAEKAPTASDEGAPAT